MPVNKPINRNTKNLCWIVICKHIIPLPSLDLWYLGTQILHKIGVLTYTSTSDGARCLRVGEGVHEKPHLPEAFHERRTRELEGESFTVQITLKHSFGVSPEKNEFGIGEDAILNCYRIFIWK